MSLGKGDPFDWLFQLLTERMGVPVTARPDTDPSQRDRIEFGQPVVGSVAWRGYRRIGAITIGFIPLVYEVSIYGATALEVAQRLADLGGWIDALVGPKQGSFSNSDPWPHDGYEFGKGSEISGGMGGGDGAGYGTTVPVTLFASTVVVQQIFGKGVVQKVPVTVIAEDALGVGAEQGPPNPARPVP